VHLAARKPGDHFARMRKLWRTASTRRKNQNRKVRFHTRDGLLLLVSIGLLFVVVFVIWLFWIGPHVGTIE
jgi:hypothetical protein